VSSSLTEDDSEAAAGTDGARRHSPKSRPTVCRVARLASEH
jgi:hypothetical protein